MVEKKQNKADMVRSSAAEYLTFIAATGDGGFEAVYADENIWLTQKMMGALYNVDVRTVNYHLKKIFSDGELDEKSVIRYFRITASDGKTYNTMHYNLKAIIAVGYKVDSARAVQFRKWAAGIIEEYTIKAYAMDDERIKNGGSILTKKYFEDNMLSCILRTIIGLALLIAAKIILGRGAGSTMNLVAIGVFIVGLFFAPAGIFLFFSNLSCYRHYKDYVTGRDDPFMDKVIKFYSK